MNPTRLDALRGPLGYLAGPLLWTLAFGLLFVAYRASVAARWPGPTLGFFAAFSVLSAVVVASVMAASQRPVGKRRDALWAVAAAGVAWAAWLPFVPTPLAALLGGAALITFANAAGTGLGRTVEEARYVWPLVLVASAVDMYSVFSAQGPSHELIQGEGVVPAYYLLLAPPIPGVGLDGVLGVGDPVFAGFLAGLAARNGLSLRRLAVGLVAGFVACMIGLITLQLPLPALPFLGTASAIALGGSVRPEPKELVLAGVFASAVVVGLLVAL